jgi:hypothetical protein
MFLDPGSEFPDKYISFLVCCSLIPGGILNLHCCPIFAFVFAQGKALRDQVIKGSFIIMKLRGREKAPW